MNIQFTLSMPSVGSWNGRWSGRDNLYAIVRPFTGRLGGHLAKAILAKGSFYYNFGDGWGASISAKAISGNEVRRVRKASKGFCGYEWMADSIIRDGAIYTDHLRPKPADAAPWPPAPVATSKPEPVPAYVPGDADIFNFSAARPCQPP